jgi:hypothetical protein
LILASFVALSLVYNVVTPAGEGVDEIPHLVYTLYVKNNHRLPVVPFVPSGGTVLMGHHPPLYYVVAALFIAPLDTSDLATALPPNPHFVWIEGSGPGNRNVFLHSPITGEDPLPWRGVVLAIHLLRLLSTAQGIAALVAVRGLSRALLGPQPVLVLAATAAVAWQPTFVSTYSLAHHDGTVALFGILGLLWAVRSVGAPKIATPLRSGALGGLILGFGTLAKTSALALVPIYGVALLLRLAKAQPSTAHSTENSGDTHRYYHRWLRAQRIEVCHAEPQRSISPVLPGRCFAAAQHDNLKREFDQALTAGWTLFPTVATAAAIGVVAVAIAGWWFARNVQLYGDPLAENVFAATHPDLMRHGPYGWGDVAAFFGQLRRTYWGAFGYMHILVDQRVGDAAWLAVGLALPGFALTLWQRRRETVTVDRWIVALAAVGAYLALFLRYSVEVAGVGHGRFFVAVFPVVTCLTMVGLARLTPARWPILPVIFAGGMGVFAGLMPSTVILPAYRPPLASPAEVRASQPVGAVYGGTLTLVADSLAPARVAPGQVARLTLFWRAASPISADLRYHLRAVAPDGTVFYDKTLLPAGGGIPTFTWPADATYRDEVTVPVPANVAPGLFRVRVDALDPTGQTLEPNSGGPVTLGPFVVAAIPTVDGLPSDATQSQARFADWLALDGYVLGKPPGSPAQLPVTLYWHALSQPPADATISVQVLNAAGQLVAQNDSEPARGRAPTTTWPPNQIVVDEHAVSLPPGVAPGQYRLVVVAYTRPSLARLPVGPGGAGRDFLDLTTIELP